jgi:inosine-uridine nucleoside N-ribohydrolase
MPKPASVQLRDALGDAIRKAYCQGLTVPTTGTPVEHEVILQSAGHMRHLTRIQADAWNAVRQVLDAHLRTGEMTDHERVRILWDVCAFAAAWLTPGEMTPTEVEGIAVLLDRDLDPGELANELRHALRSTHAR